MTPADAIKYLKEIDEPYKVELCEEHAGKNEPISFYKQGEFTDLCAGPHLMSTGKIKAVKIYVEFYSFLCIIEVAETI